MPVYFDVHTHLYDPEFDQDIDDVINMAKQEGVQGVIIVSESTDHTSRILELCQRYPDYCYAGFGVHPVQKSEDGSRSVTIDDLELMKPLIEQHSSHLVCIGEVGLDFTPRWCKTEEDKTVQRSVLTEQIEIAERLDLPLNVHSRSAGRPTISLLKSRNARNVLLHVFDGKPSVAMEGVQAGYYFSFPPSVIRSEQNKLVKCIPLDRMLLETDSPALGPEKMVRNVPSNVRLSCEYIAQMKGVDIETVSKILLENTRKLFPLLKL